MVIIHISLKLTKYDVIFCCSEAFLSHTSIKNDVKHAVWNFCLSLLAVSEHINDVDELMTLHHTPVCCSLRLLLPSTLANQSLLVDIKCILTAQESRYSLPI